MRKIRGGLRGEDLEEEGAMRRSVFEEGVKRSVKERRRMMCR
jgi:hypothetical protein